MGRQEKRSLLYISTIKYVGSLANWNQLRGGIDREALNDVKALEEVHSY